MADTGVTAQAQKNGLDHPLLEHDAAARWLGLTVEQLGPGTAVCSMVLRPEMMNGFSMAHGGMVFAFADTAFALACNPGTSPLAEMEMITVASGADVTFISPALPGETLRAAAAHRASAGRSGIYDVEITASGPNGAPRVVAEFRGRSRSVPNPAFRSRT